MKVENSYPRPQFYRENWQLLNGKWNFRFDRDNKGEKEHWEKNFPKPEFSIDVPFTYETIQSGINKKEMVNTIWYQKDLLLSKKQIEGKLFFNIEGSDYITKIFVNGQLIKEHRGAYSRISADITNFVFEGNNSIVIRVEDNNSPSQLLGKQRWIEKNFGCWYLQMTGIWKSIWIEWTKSEKYISDVKITPKFKSKQVELDINTINTNKDDVLHVGIYFEGKLVSKFSYNCVKGQQLILLDIENKMISEWGIAEWSPSDPNLYDLYLTLNSDEDEIMSYFGMREIEIQKSQIFLNGRLLYQKLILDQGYWNTTNLTPPNYEALEDDVRNIIKLGYNGVRKHQKIEDERFYYLCDKYGLLVWAEAPSPYLFCDNMISNFCREWINIVKQLYNHPSIITWTPINESWGVSGIRDDFKQQKFSEMVYSLTKSFDNSRPVIVNDGWEHTVSDIITLHDYDENPDKFFKRYELLFKSIKDNEFSHNNLKMVFAKGYSYNNQPIIISEFGGIAFEDKDNTHWGYGKTVLDEKAFVNRMDRMVSKIKNLPFICGYCYTQLTDVQQEVNGLMTEKRHYKVNPELINEINLS